MPVFIDLGSGSTTSVPPNVSADYLKRLQQVDPRRKIIKISSAFGFRRVQQVEQIDPEGIYVDVPEYKRGVNIARVDYELSLLDRFLQSQYNISTDNDRSYVLIHNFPLPVGYRPRSSHIYMRLPSDYPETPLGLTPKTGIYLTTGLTYLERVLGCANDYHAGCRCLDAGTLELMAKYNWAWWCFAKMEAWNPRRDTLIQVFVVLIETLENPRV
jgi:hypothetical protein